MSLIWRGILLGAVVGAVGGFLQSAGPCLVHDFFPRLFPGKCFYPWPVDAMVVGSGGALTYFLPGAFIGGLAGLIMQRLQRCSQKLMPLVEAGDNVWPPAPQPPDQGDATEQVPRNEFRGSE